MYSLCTLHSIQYLFTFSSSETSRLSRKRKENAEIYDTISAVPFTCPQCRATLSSDETCREHFDARQLREIEQPAYYAVHHLSVPCYMLQHNAYSRQGWLAVRDLLFQFVFGGLTPEMARRQYRAQFDGRRRTWSITRGEKLPGVEDIAWTCTIADVRLATAELYCADVLKWAKSILADSEKLIQQATNAS